MRFLPLLAILLFACDPGPTVDGGTPDVGLLPEDAGSPLIEVFAELGATNEGIALGRTLSGTPVLYVTTQDDRIVQVAADGTMSDFASIRGGLGIAIRATGELVVCGKTSVAEGDLAGLFEVSLDGTIRTLTTEGPGALPFSLTNYVAIASDGSLVFSDSAGDALYRADADGTNVALVAGAISYANGLSFSPDGTTLYVASWDTATVYALSFDSSTGVYGTPAPLLMDVRNVDGIVTQADGRLVLVTSTAGILLADPASPSTAPAELLAARAVSLPANGVFGDATFGSGELYLTSLSRSNVYVVHTARITP